VAKRLQHVHAKVTLVFRAQTLNILTMFTLEEFLSKMHVEEIDNLLFKGDALQMGLPRVFGGQVLGQALNAAVRTVEPERKPHSLHAYFLRPGDTSRPIIYEVDPILNLDFGLSLTKLLVMIRLPIVPCSPLFRTRR